jgi:hypothetical protein
MKGKIGIALMVLLLIAQAGFSYEVDSRGDISIESDGSGNFWINDAAQGVCVAVVQAQPTGDTGVYDFFCSGQSRRRVSQASTLVGLIAAATGAGSWVSWVSWAAGVIYNEVCDIFE